MNNTKQKLALAEQRSKELFAAIEGRGLIAPGKTESELITEIVELAKNEFGIEEFWHKKIVRAGVNTLQPYSSNPPDVVIQNDDMVIVDFGPVVDGWEADLGRTYVIGNDPLKLKLKSDIETAWHEARAWYAGQNNLTGAAYFNYLTQLAKKYGWEYAGEIGGHIVGHYPHEQLAPDDLGLDIHPDNHAGILQNDPEGKPRHWILEIHFVDREKNIGGFFEQLLN
ncbi:aminopeptidase [Mucilaginibacter sp. PPCGB 2223]|uniref:M24 family metallopeptidase n=1 Tax=Mucilaginibacter sp. PPCGB 2223 TaxID=1886027 RepID=UPI0008271A64|nr:M24 family metallopeptidase [Mucilaginibacter sp. PPCGB 2223]OCX52695.1 aminopeptidase [Mucilaginibacter sp. PPCGB 2223]